MMNERDRSLICFGQFLAAVEDGVRFEGQDQIFRDSLRELCISRIDVVALCGSTFEDILDRLAE